ncbi:MAG: GNAT family N-acetyltransferase [Chlamydiota bacterium]
MRKNSIYTLILLVCISPLFSSLHIRPAEELEIPKLYQLICELASSEGQNASLTQENLRLFGFGEKPIFFTEVAEVDGQIVGYALYFFTFSPSQGWPSLYLKDLYVKPEYQNRGIGTRLLKQLAHYAQERQCCRMEWLVSDWNERAIAFYQKFGAKLKNSLIPVRLGKDAIDRLASEEDSSTQP